MGGRGSTYAAAYAQVDSVATWGNGETQATLLAPWHLIAVGTNKKATHSHTHTDI